MVEQDSPTVVAFRKAEAGFVPEFYTGLGAMVSLPEIGIELPLAEIYERVEFSPQPGDDEA